MEREIVDKMISLYSSIKNLKIVAKELDIPWQTVYWHLKKEGVSVTGNKSVYGCIKDRIAVIGEGMFRKSFPMAEDQNELSYQPEFDFVLNDLKIDIKTSFPRDMKSRGKTQLFRWGFNTRRQQSADYIVCYCLQGTIDEYVLEHILLLPKEFIEGMQTVSVSCKGRSKWLDFKVTEDELIDFLTQHTKKAAQH